MPVVRTNYRLTGGRLRFGGLQSVFIIDSYAFNTGLASVGPYTVSMGGYGAPSYLMVIGVSSPTDCASCPRYFLFTQSNSGSYGWLYYLQSSGSPDATATTRVLFAALIGSR